MGPVVAGKGGVRSSRRGLRLRVLACASLLAMNAAVAAPALGDTAKTEFHVDLSKGFARIVFDLSQNTQAQSEFAFGVLVLRFQQNVAPDLEALRVALGPYVSLVREDADGRTLRFALRGPVRVEQNAIGNQLAVDLFPPTYAGNPPPFNGLTVSEAGIVAADITPTIVASEARDRRAIASFARPAPLPIIPVRAGELKSFTRIVFDWPFAVEYAIEPGIGSSVVRFSRAAQLDLSELRTNPPRFIHGAHSEILGGKVSAVIEIDPNVEVRDLRDGNKIVLDLSQRAPDPAAESDHGPPGDDASALAMNYEHSLPEHSAAASGAAAPRNGALDDAGAVLTGAVDHRLPPKAEAAPIVHEETPPPPSPVAMAPAGTLSYLPDGADTLIVAPFVHETSGAVFRRGDTLWMVFDTPEAIDAGVPGRDVLHDIGAVSASVEDGARVLRVELKNEALIDVSQEGPRWMVRVAHGRVGSSESVGIAREVSSSGEARLRFSAQAAKLHWLKDPYLGDDVLVATSKLPKRGVTADQKFVQLAVIGSAHGLALSPYSDDISVRLEHGDVVVGDADGLAITASESINRGSIHSPVERIDHPGFLDFATWRGKEGLVNFVPQRQALTQALAHAPESQRAMARLALARFYAANGFGAEALGMLDYMLNQDPRMENAPAFHALRGAALYMMARYHEAQREFANGSLANDHDVAPWRGALATKLERYSAASDAFAQAGDIIARYPPDWQARFRFAQARAALARNDVKSAAAAMSALPAERLDPRAKVEADLVAGKIFEAQGKNDDALAHYNFAAKGPRGEAQAEARLSAADLAVASGAMSAHDATQALEVLRYDWRGDNLELATLARLGEIYAQDRRYRDGLSTLRSAVAYFSDNPRTREISQTMSTIFRKLYLEGAADAMKPVEALALYYDFRELTPVGRDGDDMIRRLAERLVVVDLLPQAAELLQYQVDNRLDGAARAQVATRLAMIYLMDHKPEVALRAIRTTRQVQLPDSIQRQRRLLEARALAEVKQYDAALEVLLYDEGPETERIRADVYWKAQNWSAAAEHIESLLADRWRDARPLEDEERFQIMRAAISYLFANDDFGLSSLKDRYGVAMKASSDGAAFTLVTEKPDTTSSDFGELARRIASVDTLDAFMASFERESADTPPATN